jgi:hypothetical protein
MILPPKSWRLLEHVHAAELNRPSNKAKPAVETVSRIARSIGEKRQLAILGRVQNIFSAVPVTPSRRFSSRAPPRTFSLRWVQLRRPA